MTSQWVELFCSHVDDLLYFPGSRWEGCALPWPAVFSKFSGLCPCVHMLTVYFGNVLPLDVYSAWASWVVLDLCCLHAQHGAGSCSWTFASRTSLVLPWKNGIRQGKFSLKPVFYITQEQQSQWLLISTIPDCTPFPKCWDCSHPTWLRSHHFASLNSLKVIVSFFGGTEIYALQPLPESLLCSEKTASHLAQPCPKCLPPSVSSPVLAKLCFCPPSSSISTSHDLDPFLLLK